MATNASWFLALCLLSPTPPAAAASSDDGNCGVKIPFAEQAGDRHSLESVSFLGTPHDLEDALWSIESRQDYKQILEACGRRRSPPNLNLCRTFGVHQWNLSSHRGLKHIVGKSRERRLHAEDQAVWDTLSRDFFDGEPPCTPESSVCAPGENGELRLVSLSMPMSRQSLKLWAKLPHLFSLHILEVRTDSEDDAEEGGLEGLALPRSVRSVTFEMASTKAAEVLAAKLREHGAIQSLSIFGRQNLEWWLPLDLGIFCDGLEHLLRFSAYVLDVKRIPECWSGARRLESFYCTNCMMTELPTALRGLQSLKSFVAFRQSEMIPCAAKRREKEFGPCQLSWETKMLLKGNTRRMSTGRYEDFQEGPSYKCHKSSYGFPFKDFLTLDWKNIEKVWLDGNFLTGEVPPEIATAWPRLQSLDLYDNAMTGTIPAELASLDFVKLQLNGNDFSGELPTAVADMLKTRFLVLGVADNPQLRGCLPDVTQGMALTQLTPCGSGSDASEEL